MKTIEVTEELAANRDEIFAIFADHASYTRFAGIDGAELTRHGKENKNGQGAQRKIVMGPITLWEDILSFEENTLLEYRIVKAKPGLLEHKLGRMRFTEIAGGRTRVEWTSTFRIRMPIIASVMEKVVASRFQKGFTQALRTAERAALT